MTAMDVDAGTSPPCRLLDDVPRALVRSEILLFADGASVAAACAAAAPLRDAGRAAAKAQLDRRFAWCWPSLLKGGAARDRRPLNLDAPGALAALEARSQLLVACGTREDLAPTADAAAVPWRGAASPAPRPVASCASPRNAPAAARTALGNVWLCGGWDGNAPMKSCEVFDAARKEWRPAPDLRNPRCFAAASATERHRTLLRPSRDEKRPRGYSVAAMIPRRRVAATSRGASDGDIP